MLSKIRRCVVSRGRQETIFRVESNVRFDFLIIIRIIGLKTLCLAGKFPFFIVLLSLLEEIAIESVSQVAIEVFQFNDPVVVLIIDKLNYGPVPVSALDVDEVIGLHHEPHTDS